MPKLPSAESFGARPSARVPSQVVGFRGGVAESAEAQGQRGVAQVAGSLSDAFAPLVKAEADIRTREEAVDRARAVGEYSEAANAEMRRLETEGDFSSLATTKAYGQFLNDQFDKTIGAHTGSGASQSALQIRLEAIRTAAATRAGDMGVAAQRKLVTSQLGREMNALTSRAIDNPSSLSDLFSSWDDIIDDMAPALTPEEEESFRSSGRQETTISALTGLFAAGDVNGARELHNTPGVREMLTPEQQRQFDGTFTEYDRKQNEFALNAQRKIKEAELIKGAPLSTSERVRLAGLEPKEGRETASDKIKEVESALGRSLTPDERGRVAGLDPADAQKAQTDAGQTVQDREMFVEQFGESSPQVLAFDEAVDSEDEVPSLSEEAGVRKEFTKLSGDFIKIRDAFAKIAEVKKNPSAAGDVSLVFAFMKILDPGSTVREGEQATAREAKGVPATVLNTYNRIVTGENLTPDQRSDFLNQSENLMRAQLRNQVAMENQFRGIAERSRLDPENVVVDFVGQLRAGLNGGGDGQGGAAETQGELPPIEYGLDGKRIGVDK